MLRSCLKVFFFFFLKKREISDEKGLVIGRLSWGPVALARHGRGVSSCSLLGPGHPETCLAHMLTHRSVMQCFLMWTAASQPRSSDSLSFFLGPQPTACCCHQRCFSS